MIEQNALLALAVSAAEQVTIYSFMNSLRDPEHYGRLRLAYAMYRRGKLYNLGQCGTNLEVTQWYCMAMTGVSPAAFDRQINPNEQIKWRAVNPRRLAAIKKRGFIGRTIQNPLEVWCEWMGREPRYRWVLWVME
jgi:hypothetical protein